jgi:hypothetical protein
MKTHFGTSTAPHCPTCGGQHETSGQWVRQGTQVVVQLGDDVVQHEDEELLGGLWNWLTGCKFEDRTHLTPKDKRKGKPRDMSKVYALVLHQTGGNHLNTPPNRYDKVTAHFVIKPNGQILQLHPPSAFLSASHGLNARSVAVEFAGNFPSTRGKWHPPGRLCGTM